MERPMTIISKDNLPAVRLPGRVIYKAVGKDGESKSTNMSVGFGHYSAESGIMEPHRHAEESVFIVASQKGIVRYGGEKDSLLHSQPLEPGMLLHIPENGMARLRIWGGRICRYPVLLRTGERHPSRRRGASPLAVTRWIPIRIYGR